MSPMSGFPMEKRIKLQCLSFDHRLKMEWTVSFNLGEDTPVRPAVRTAIAFRLAQ
jgi:hypothetical protein